MNSRLLLALAVLLLLGASIAGYMGYKTTVDARDAAVAAEKKALEAANAGTSSKDKTTVIVLRQAVPAYKALVAEDIAVDYLKFVPPNTFRKPEEVIGQAVQTDLPVGTVLDSSHFSPGGKVARLIKPGERAVAIPVNEVVGSGGFVQPGDMVDVLLYLAGAEGQRNSAQVVMRSLRVLSFGANLIEPEPEATPEDEKGAKEAAKPVRQAARTAVLAVAQADVTRLLLASSLGELRLAIVPTEEMRLASGGAEAAPVASNAFPSARLPEVDMLAVPSKPSAVPAQRFYLTSSVLQGAASPSPSQGAPVRHARTRTTAPAPQPVVIIRGLSAETSK